MKLDRRALDGRAQRDAHLGQPEHVGDERVVVQTPHVRVHRDGDGELRPRLERALRRRDLEARALPLLKQPVLPAPELALRTEGGAALGREGLQPLVRVAEHRSMEGELRRAPRARPFALRRARRLLLRLGRGRSARRLLGAPCARRLGQWRPPGRRCARESLTQLLGLGLLLGEQVGLLELGERGRRLRVVLRHGRVNELKRQRRRWEALSAQCVARAHGRHVGDEEHQRALLEDGHALAVVDHGQRGRHRRRTHRDGAVLGDHVLGRLDGGRHIDQARIVLREALVEDSEPLHLG